MKKEMAGVIFKTAQEQMAAALVGHCIILAPTFASCLIALGSFTVIESALLLILMSPGDDEYIRNAFAPFMWGVGGTLAAYIYMHREIKRHITDRKLTLKSQQMVAILDSQSDAIVAIESASNEAN